MQHSCSNSTLMKVLNRKRTVARSRYPHPSALVPIPQRGGMGTVSYGQGASSRATSMCPLFNSIWRNTKKVKMYSKVRSSHNMTFTDTLARARVSVNAILCDALNDTAKDTGALQASRAKRDLIRLLVCSSLAHSSRFGDTKPGRGKREGNTKFDRVEHKARA